jgi:LemA protein
MTTNTFTILGSTSLFFIVIFFFLVLTYNMFIRRRNQVKTDFSDIDVQLKRRASLIEQLAGMVREYAKHEKSTYENVSKARSALDNSKSVKDTSDASNMFTQTLKSLFAVVENYPKLQANQSYQILIENLRETEDNIAEYREEYNHTVLEYNNSIQTFPNLLAANLFRFYEEDFLQFPVTPIPVTK